MIKNPICIVTDDTVQYSKPTFPGAEFIYLASLQYSLNNNDYKSMVSDNSIIWDKPKRISDQHYKFDKKLKIFSDQIIDLHKQYNDVILVLHSQYLSNAFEIALQITKTISEKSRIHIFDSNSFSFGLGLIVKKAAGLISNGSCIEIVTQTIRKTIPHIYGIFFSQNHSRLTYPGFLTYEQAFALDLLGQIPVFTIEDGRFNPFGKVNNIRNGINSFEEFIDEFDQLEDIIFVSGIHNKSREIAQLRSHCLDIFPRVNISYQFLSRNTAAIIGSNAMGVFVMEKVNK